MERSPTSQVITCPLGVRARRALLISSTILCLSRSEAKATTPWTPTSRAFQSQALLRIFSLEHTSARQFAKVLIESVRQTNQACWDPCRATSVPRSSSTYRLLFLYRRKQTSRVPVLRTQYKLATSLAASFTIETSQCLACSRKNKTRGWTSIRSDKAKVISENSSWSYKAKWGT